MSLLTTHSYLQISCQPITRQSRITAEQTYSNSDFIGMPAEDDIVDGQCSDKETRSAIDFEYSFEKSRTRKTDGVHASSTGATPRQQRASKSSKRSSIASSSNGQSISTMINNYLPSHDNNNDEHSEPIINPTLTPNFNSRQYESSIDSSDNECRIIPVEKDDYLETLDRKVTEVINQSRISNGGIVASTTTELNRKSSGGRRHHRAKPSPGSAKRITTKTPSSSDNIGNVESSSNCAADENIYNGNVPWDGAEGKANNGYLSSIVRFDEKNGNSGQDAGSDTQESSQERWSDGEDAGSEEGGNMDERNIIRRRRYK